MQKLTLDQAIQCRRRHAAGETVRSLAREHRVSAWCMKELLRGDSHRPRLTLDLSPELVDALVRVSTATSQTLEQAALAALRTLLD